MDFSSAPGPKKPITVAVGHLLTEHRRSGPAVYFLDSVVCLDSFAGFDAFLMHPGPWVAGFDLPFSMPRALIEHYNWPSSWAEFIDWYAVQPREDLRLLFKRFCDGRPAGSKYVYRKTDKPAGSSPAMRWTNPPVAWMTHAGMPRIKSAGLHIPGLHHGADPRESQRVALEAYPGFTARKVTKASYKSDDRHKQTPERKRARKEILTALCEARAGLNVRLECSHDWFRLMHADGSGDLMDAAICGLQAAHACLEPGFGFPKDLDGLEGWIASVPATEKAIKP